MKYTLVSLLALLASLTLAAQEGSSLVIETPEGARPWTSLELNNEARNFQFAIVTDRTGGHRPGVFMDGVRKLNLIQPEFVMSVGDLIEGYTEDLTELNRQWDEFDGFVNALQMPFFYVPGNHDITNKVMEGLWRKRLGPTYYSFVYHDVLFMCLNSEDRYRGAGNGSISDEQYDWIKKTLSEHEDVRWTLLFMHQPLWLQETDPVRWADVEALLQNRPHSVFVGHRHHYVKYERNNGKYFMLATTGGGSRLRGPELGEFDHVVWVTMTDDGPVIANLALDGIWNENVVTEETQGFIERVSQAPFLRFEPFYTDREAITEGTVRLRLTNDEDTPMIVRLRDGFSWDYISHLEADTILVAPNSVAFTTLTLQPRRQKPLVQTDPVELHASIEFPAADRPDLAIPYSYKVRPENAYVLQPAVGKITIDGKLPEWTELPYRLDTPDPDDLEGRFNILYDEEYLYVAGEVRDDNLMLNTSMVTWQQDYIGFVINADPTAESAMRTGQRWYINSLILIASPETGQAPVQTFYEERLPEGTRYRCLAEGDTYRMEVAIPISYVKERQGENWKSLRVNFTAQDWDKADEEKPRFGWQPDWRGDDNRVGSGMFFREAPGQ